MPKPNAFPIPKKRYHGSRWIIYWHWKSKQYAIATNYFDPKKTIGIDSDLRIVTAALATDPPRFPDALLNEPSVITYMQNRNQFHSDVSADSDWLASYEREIYSEVSETWAKQSMVSLNLLAKEIGDIRVTNAAKLTAYLANIAATRSAATRNRNLMIFSRFFNWAVDTGRAIVSPTAKIEQLPEERSSDIVYCTHAEMNDLILRAWATGLPEWLAVPIAFHSGMRREEISRLDWNDINMRTGNLVVRKTKTRKSRTFPMSKTLEEYLLLIPRRFRKGPVVTIPEEFSRLDRLNTMTGIMHRGYTRLLLARRALKRPPPSKAKDYRSRLKKFNEKLAQVKKDVENHAKIVGWNAFRHTFASLRVQNGVSLDKICSWMGNTRDVCERHYAQFVPKDKRDADIDLDD